MQSLVFTGFLDALSDAPLPLGQTKGATLITLVDRERAVNHHNPFADYEHRRAEEQKLRLYGRQLFRRFAHRYADVFVGFSDAFAFLADLNVEGRDGGPSRLLTVERPDPRMLVLDYRSPRPVPHVCWGLLEGCIAHFGTLAAVDMLPIVGGETTRYRFHVICS